jgi:leucyl-tRNA synthetase
LSKEELEKRTLADPKIAQLLEGKRVVKVIVVPNKLVNIVVS